MVHSSFYERGESMCEFRIELDVLIVCQMGVIARLIIFLVFKKGGVRFARAVQLMANVYVLCDVARVRRGISLARNV